MASRGTVRVRDNGADALLKRMKGAGELYVTVGVMEPEGAAAVDGEEGITVLDVAAINEFGGPDNNPPARSFIGAWADENETVNQERLAKIGQAVMKGTIESVEQGLERFGVLAVGDVQKRIAAGIAPENAPSTVARKGSSTPLIDTGQLRSSISYAIEKK